MVRFFWYFFGVLGGCFCVFLCFFLYCFSRVSAKKCGFIFRGEPSKAGNFLSAKQGVLPTRKVITKKKQTSTGGVIDGNASKPPLNPRNATEMCDPAGSRLWAMRGERSSRSPGGTATPQRDDGAARLEMERWVDAPHDALWRCGWWFAVPVWFSGPVVHGVVGGCVRAPADVGECGEVARVGCRLVVLRWCCAHARRVRGVPWTRCAIGTCARGARRVRDTTHAVRNVCACVRPLAVSRRATRRSADRARPSTARRDSTRRSSDAARPPWGESDQRRPIIAPTLMEPCSSAAAAAETCPNQMIISQYTRPDLFSR